MIHRILQAVAIAVLLSVTVAGATPADAQCRGDCNGNGQVAINELITGVNIALGLASVSTCASFDANGDGQVAINELIAAVNNALNGCTAGPTPTPTQTPMQTVGNTATVTPTRPISAQCGNGVVDNNAGETCDDGNRIDDDGCPSNCRVESCEPGAERLRVAVDFTSNDPELFLIGLRIFLRYPDGVIDVPGQSSEQPVIDAVTSDIFAVTPRDFDYGVRILFEDPSLVGYSDGTAATVEFLVCSGATAPPVSAISCVVEDATDPDFVAVPPAQIGCTLRPAS